MYQEPTVVDISSENQDIYEIHLNQYIELLPIENADIKKQEADDRFATAIRNFEGFSNDQVGQWQLYLRMNYLKAEALRNHLFDTNLNTTLTTQERIKTWSIFLNALHQIDSGRSIFENGCMSVAQGIKHLVKPQDFTDINLSHLLALATNFGYLISEQNKHQSLKIVINKLNEGRQFDSMSIDLRHLFAWADFFKSHSAFSKNCHDMLLTIVQHTQQTDIATITDSSLVGSAAAHFANHVIYFLDRLEPVERIKICANFSSALNYYPDYGPVRDSISQICSEETLSQLQGNDLESLFTLGYVYSQYESDPNYGETLKRITQRLLLTDLKLITSNEVKIAFAKYYINRLHEDIHQEAALFALLPARQIEKYRDIAEVLSAIDGANEYIEQGAIQLAKDINEINFDTNRLLNFIPDNSNMQPLFAVGKFLSQFSESNDCAVALNNILAYAGILFSKPNVPLVNLSATAKNYTDDLLPVSFASTLSTTETLQRLLTIATTFARLNVEDVNSQALVHELAKVFNGLMLKSATEKDLKSLFSLTDYFSKFPNDEECKRAKENILNYAEVADLSHIEAPDVLSAAAKFFTDYIQPRIMDSSIIPIEKIKKWVKFIKEVKVPIEADDNFQVAYGEIDAAINTLSLDQVTGDEIAPLFSLAKLVDQLPDYLSNVRDNIISNVMTYAAFTRVEDIRDTNILFEAARHYKQFIHPNINLSNVTSSSRIQIWSNHANVFSNKSDNTDIQDVRALIAAACKDEPLSSLQAKDLINLFKLVDHFNELSQEENCRLAKDHILSYTRSMDGVLTGPDVPQEILSAAAKHYVDHLHSTIITANQNPSESLKQLAPFGKLFEQLSNTDINLKNFSILVGTTIQSLALNNLDEKNLEFLGGLRNCLGRFPNNDICRSALSAISSKVKVAAVSSEVTNSNTTTTEKPLKDQQLNEEKVTQFIEALAKEEYSQATQLLNSLVSHVPQNTLSKLIANHPKWEDFDQKISSLLPPNAMANFRGKATSPEDIRTERALENIIFFIDMLNKKHHGPLTSEDEAALVIVSQWKKESSGQPLYSYPAFHSIISETQDYKNKMALYKAAIKEVVPEIDDEQGTHYLQKMRALIKNSAIHNLAEGQAITDKLREEGIAPQSHLLCVGNILFNLHEAGQLDALENENTFLDLQNLVMNLVKHGELNTRAKSYQDKLIPYSNNRDTGYVPSYEIYKIVRGILSLKDLDIHTAKTPSINSNESTRQENLLLKDLHELMIKKKMIEDVKLTTEIVKQLANNNNWQQAMNADPVIKKKNESQQELEKALSLELTSNAIEVFKVAMTVYLIDKPQDKKNANVNWFKTIMGHGKDNLTCLTHLRNYFDAHPNEIVPQDGNAINSLKEKLLREAKQKFIEDKQNEISKVTQTYLDGLVTRVRNFDPSVAEVLPITSTETSLTAEQQKIIDNNSYARIPLVEQSRNVEPLHVAKDGDKVISVLVRRLDDNGKNVQLVPADWINENDLVEVGKLISRNNSPTPPGISSLPRHMNLQLKAPSTSHELEKKISVKERTGMGFNKGS